MASYIDISLAIQPGGYKLIDLGSNGYTGIDVLAEGEVAIACLTADQPQPAAWTQNPLAASQSNLTANARHMRAGDSFVKGFDPPPNKALGDSGANDPTERLRWIQVWGIGSGYLNIGTTRR